MFEASSSETEMPEEIISEKGLFYFDTRLSLVGVNIVWAEHFAKLLLHSWWIEIVIYLSVNSGLWNLSHLYNIWQVNYNAVIFSKYMVLYTTLDKL